MTEATWGGSTRPPTINWRMSAALENVPRGDSSLAEVTNLERAVRDWVKLDTHHQSAAVLTTEHAVQLDGVSVTTFAGASIAALVDYLPVVSAAAK